VRNRPLWRARWLEHAFSSPLARRTEKLRLCGRVRRKCRACGFLPRRMIAVFFRSLSNKFPVIHIFASFVAFFREASAPSASPSRRLWRKSGSIRGSGEPRSRQVIVTDRSSIRKADAFSGNGNCCATPSPRGRRLERSASDGRGRAGQCGFRRKPLRRN
jgi:hypothetical protein